MYISIPTTIFCFVLGYIAGIISTILFGNYLAKIQEKEILEKSRRIMQMAIDKEKDKEDKD